MRSLLAHLLLQGSQIALHFHGSNGRDEQQQRERTLKVMAFGSVLPP
jgi:hypothetical protein